jgi:hypothetical protein
MQAKLRAPEDGLGRIGFIGFRLPRCGDELSRRRLLLRPPKGTLFWLVALVTLPPESVPYSSETNTLRIHLLNARRYGCRWS